MFPVVRIFFALVLLGFLTGCELNRVLIIKADGSGRIEERMLAPRDSYVTESKPGEPLSIGLPRPNATTVSKKAAEYGEGVEVVSFKQIEEGDMLGYEAVYTFNDISKLDAGVFLNKEGASDAVKPGGEATPSHRFELIRGPVNELRIPTKETKSAAKDNSPPAPASDDPKQREAITEAFKHLKVHIAIHVEGTIESTTSHFHEGNDVVLFEMNTKDMASDPKYADLFKKDAKEPLPKDPPEDTRYFKHEDMDAVSIRFK